MIQKVSRRLWILINKFRFKAHGFQVGGNMLVFNKLYIRKWGKAEVKIGDNFGFSTGGGYNPLSRNVMGAFELEDNAKLTIGNNVGISSSCLWVYDSLTIGNNTKIGADCIIMDSDAHSLNYLDRRNSKTDRPNAKKQGITIGEDVLIGTRCIVLKGVSIGNRSIIGSGSVVVKSIPDDCIAAGNPAKVIKMINKEA